MTIRWNAFIFLLLFIKDETGREFEKKINGKLKLNDSKPEGTSDDLKEVLGFSSTRKRIPAENGIWNPKISRIIIE
ncbi:MAG: hypothetical protein PVG49_09155 [Desulfobacteraceae bacterium]|jgi:hypothetical protein